LEKWSSFRLAEKRLLMQVVRFYEYGGPEVLKMEDAPGPEPGPGEARETTGKMVLLTDQP
jgi:hypothetical protein